MTEPAQLRHSPRDKRELVQALRLPQRPLLTPPSEFRSWSTEDIPSLVTAWRDPEMHRGMPEEEEPFDESRARQFVASASAQLAEGTMLAIAISDPSGETVGSVREIVEPPPDDLDRE